MMQRQNIKDCTSYLEMNVKYKTALKLCIMLFRYLVFSRLGPRDNENRDQQTFWGGFSIPLVPSSLLQHRARWIIFFTRVKAIAGFAKASE
jgi:hypothetical protein